MQLPAYVKNVSKTALGSASVCGSTRFRNSPAMPYLPVSSIGFGHGTTPGVESLMGNSSFMTVPSCGEVEGRGSRIGGPFVAPERCPLQGQTNVAGRIGENDLGGLPILPVVTARQCFRWHARFAARSRLGPQPGLHWVR